MGKFMFFVSKINVLCDLIIEFSQPYVVLISGISGKAFDLPSLEFYFPFCQELYAVYNSVPTTTIKTFCEKHNIVFDYFPYFPHYDYLNEIIQKGFQTMIQDNIRKNFDTETTFFAIPIIWTEEKTNFLDRLITELSVVKSAIEFPLKGACLTIHIIY